MVVAFEKICKALLVSVLTGRKNLHIQNLVSISGVSFPLCLSIFSIFQLKGCHKSDNVPAHSEGTNVLQHWVNQEVDQTTSFLVKLLWF